MSKTYEELLKIGRSKAFAKGYGIYFADYYAEGYAKGYAKGYMEGYDEARMYKLLGILAENCLIDEVKKAIEDKEYRESLYTKYNL